ncbi:MAG: L,D-transpeptidase [Saprospiraceae bacterium]|nr:L,D-transpeptidase [Saprospiraceae bacterium]
MHAIQPDSLPPEPALFYVVQHEVPVKSYFKFMDTLCRRLDTLVDYDLDETLLTRANPWLMDTLILTDYYLRKARGEFVYDQTLLVVLRHGDTLRLPSPAQATALKSSIQNTWLDVNIPEFRMRIVEGSDTLFSFPVRVGQNRQRYLEAINRVEVLRTRKGEGEIFRINRNPVWSNPVTGKSYKETERDDGLRTKLPQIPWLEPVINGIRYGQMIHPTTNPETLGKAYSNGCIGTSEADAWRVYFFAPLGTKVVIRYDLAQILPSGDTLLLKDVYSKRTFKLK